MSRFLSVFYHSNYKPTEVHWPDFFEQPLDMKSRPELRCVVCANHLQLVNKGTEQISIVMRAARIELCGFGTFPMPKCLAGADMIQLYWANKASIHDGAQ